MIKEKDLIKGTTIVVHDGAEITLDYFETIIGEDAAEKSIPVAFERDQVKLGSFIGGSLENCLIVYHPEHRQDYLFFVLRLKQMGSDAYIYINKAGNSKMLNKVVAAQARQEAREERRGMPIKERIGTAVIDGLIYGFSGIGASESLYETENLWYEAIAGIINSYTE